MLAAMPWIFKMRFLLPACFLLSFPALAEKEKEACVPPEAPAIMDGRSARKQQMLDMRQAVETFVIDNFTYRECLQDELKTLGDSPKARSIKAFINEAITDSLDMDDLVADTFNTQLRIYKSMQE
jgi:hypothetical protein